MSKIVESSSPKYSGFLGTWDLLPESCDYQQGDAPRSGTYLIEEDESGRLSFTVDWTDAEGASHQATLSGMPDGKPAPFAGGDLADAVSVQAVSTRELNSSAFYKGKKRMVAQRQLDDTGMAMRVTQVIYFPDGSQLANVGIYRKRVLN